ncbi:MAG TPA: aspartate aminotransferase family protein [Gaiellaceae bacterium]|nr:aspartate aminotransferase family protein [Gaiellaceae bacterium]
MTRFWHPFADMRVVHQELVLARGEGTWIWDDQGRRYLDGTAGLWYCNVGYGRRELAEAAAFQLQQLAAYSAYGDLATRPVLDLAERVSLLSPAPDGVVFFTSGGSDAIDSAAKLVRRYWDAVGEPQRQLIVVREGAYHGVNGFGTSLAGIGANSAGYGDLVPGVVRLPRDDALAFERLAAERGGEIAGFFGEPVLGAGGVYPPVAGYWDKVQQVCKACEALLVVDEVITGFGRLGRWFGSERYHIEPDLLVCAKGITSGYIPLGAVVCGARVAEPFWRGDAGMFRHGYTYSGHATACAVALANIDILEREQLVESVGEREAQLEARLRSLAAHPLVEQVRTVGLLAGVELAAEAIAHDPTLADRVVAAARDEGLLVRHLLGKAIQISPAFVISEHEIDLLAAALEAALDRSVAEISTALAS